MYGGIPRTAWYPQVSGRPGSSFSVVTIPTTLALEETKRLLQQCPGGEENQGFFSSEMLLKNGISYGEVWGNMRIEWNIYIYVCVYIYIYA
jgi:hypothetical protein